MKSRKRNSKTKLLKESVFAILGLSIIVSAAFLIWIATIKLPDFNDFENRKIANSTKIYDRTGTVLLYNVHDNIKRTQIKKEDVSDYIKKATVAIEDDNFYNHIGISPRGILRSVWVAVKTGTVSQGGSTITQQVIKNALLTSDRTLVRKLKEWVLAIKLDSQVSKDDILNIYLNESPYGGSIYGVEEASLSYFDKHAKDVTLAEAAYLAGMPQAPSRYSPYSSNPQSKTLLENRKNTVLARMLETGVITQEEYDTAKNEVVVFNTKENSSGKAFHFVFYVRDYLEDKYGKDAVENGGMKIISTLDWDLQKNAEEIVKEGALKNQGQFGAGNSALVAIDPKTGQILSMVGSRDYFDEEIDGKYNVALALRQPGSTFKPFVYVQALMRGFEAETVLFDLPTQFSTNCDAYGNSLNGGDCYSPSSYDGNFHGPVSIRVALQNSLNIPAVKLLYLVGIKNTLDFVKTLGISTLGDYSRFGLSLVLGGGEVTLLELTNAYGVFANNGIYNPPVAILEVYDKDGNVLEKYTKKETDVIPKEYTDKLSNILSDPYARSLTFSATNPINFYDRQVAAKTGTTNDFKDVWVVGYTPSLVVGMWGGNNDNKPVARVAGTVLSPVWRKFMNYALKDKPLEYFDKATTSENKPVYIRGVYCSAGNISTILQYVGGSGSAGGYSDPQYNLWNTPIQEWAQSHVCPFGGSAPVNEGSTTQEQINPLNIIIPQTIIPQ